MDTSRCVSVTRFWSAARHPAKGARVCHVASPCAGRECGVYEVMNVWGTHWHVATYKESLSKEGKSGMLAIPVCNPDTSKRRKEQ